MSDDMVSAGLPEFFGHIDAAYRTIRAAIGTRAPKGHLPVLGRNGANLTEVKKWMQLSLIDVTYADVTEGVMRIMTYAVSDWLGLVHAAEQYHASRSPQDRMLAAEAARRVSDSVRDLTALP